MLQPIRLLHFRPGKRSALPLPVAVRSTGHYRLTAQTREETPEVKPFYQLFWTIAGSGKVPMDGGAGSVGPGDCFLHRPGDQHTHQRAGEIWEHRWLTLDAAASAGVMDALPDRGKIWRAGPCPVEAFEALTEAVDDPTAAGERRASAHAYRILVAAWFGALDPDPDHPLAARAKAWLLAHYREPATTVEGLADVCRVHRSTLFRAFEEAFGLSPADYLRRLRIQHGLRLLKETDLPVQVIAHRCGYTDANYFARAIRKAKGKSPLAFRRSAE